MAQVKQAPAPTHPEMLDWQLRMLLGELQQVQLHGADPTCPCTLKDYNEWCIPKHLLNVATLAGETGAMDPNNAATWYDLQVEAVDMHQKARAAICETGDPPDVAAWARDVRKEIEPLYYNSCSLASHVMGLAQSITVDQAPAKVAIRGTCDGRECTIKVKASETVSRDSNIAGLQDAIGTVIREMEERRQAEGSSLTFALGPDRLTRYEFEYKVVDASQLVASHDPHTFEPNPDYPPELQPRLRARAANRSQVQEMADHLDPEALLTDFHSIDRGAPIVGPDNVVESGNGRVMALQLAASDFPESYAHYKSELLARLPAFALTEGDIPPGGAPVLVRERLTEMDRRTFVEQANASTVLTPSAIETARSDAAKISPAMLSFLEVGPDQGIEDALRSARNADFVRLFMQEVPAQERAQLTDAHGNVSQDGLRRMTMALFMSALPGDPGLRMAEKYFEATDVNVRNVFNGVAAALGQLAQSEALTRSGDRDPALSIGEDLALTVGVFGDIKRTPGMTVQKYLQQVQMFERQLNPFQESLLELIDDRSRSGRKIAELLRAYADVVISSPPPGQIELMPGERLTKEAALELAASKAKAAEPATLFQAAPAWCGPLKVADREMGKTMSALASTRTRLAVARAKFERPLGVCAGQAPMFSSQEASMERIGTLKEYLENRLESLHSYKEPFSMWADRSQQEMGGRIDEVDNTLMVIEHSPTVTTMRALIRAKTIILDRVEGSHVEVGRPEARIERADHEDIWSTADSTLKDWSETAPKEGGYDKTDFTIVYDDGETYKGRYDLKHWTVEYPDLAKHVYHFVGFHAGVYKPPHLTAEEYAEILNRLWVKEIPEFQKFLQTYEIGHYTAVVEFAQDAIVTEIASQISGAGQAPMLSSPAGETVMAQKSLIAGQDPLLQLVASALQGCLSGGGSCVTLTGTKSPYKCKPVGDYVHCQLQPKRGFDSRSFRTIKPKEGVKITIGCPTGDWDPSKQLCKVSTQAQRIMYRKDVCPQEEGCILEGPK